jgi:hypothetical protein
MGGSLVENLTVGAESGGARATLSNRASQGKRFAGLIEAAWCDFALYPGLVVRAGERRTDQSPFAGY